jgi:hypothetical protein
VASYFNLASGALTPLALSAMSIFQIILGSRKGDYREWSGIGALCTLALVMTLSIDGILSQGPLGPHSIEQFVSAFLTVAAWPLSPAFAVVVHAPMIALLASLIKDRPNLRDGRWIMFGLWIWLGMQFAALAYGRASGVVLSSRYMDSLLVGLILNFTALLRLLPDRPRLSVSFLLASAWLLAISIGAVHEAVLKAAPGVAEHHRITDIETRNVRGYVATGDFAFLNGKPLLEIPFPDANFLRTVLDTPEVRAILPPTLVDGGVPARSSVVSLRDFLLSHGPFLVVVGIVLLLFGILRTAWPIRAFTPS